MSFFTVRRGKTRKNLDYDVLLAEMRLCAFFGHRDKCVRQW